MDTDLLTTFLAVARHGSYTKAMHELHLSQSAIWRQMQRLEKKLGVRLFTRIGQAVRLTDAGKTLLSEAELLLGDLRRARERVRASASEIRGEIRIGASTTPGHYVLPVAIGEFHRRFPDVDIRFEISNSAGVVRQILRDELDIAFVGGALAERNLTSRQCVPDEIFCFASPGHPLARARRVSPKELDSHLCLLREVGSSTRHQFQEWLTRAGGRLGRTMTVSCPESLKAMVAAGVGFSILSVHGLQREIARGELAKLRVSRMALRRAITMAWHVNKHLSPTVRAFIDAVEQTCRTISTETPGPSPR